MGGKSFIGFSGKVSLTTFHLYLYPKFREPIAGNLYNIREFGIKISIGNYPLRIRTQDLKHPVFVTEADVLYDKTSPKHPNIRDLQGEFYNRNIHPKAVVEALFAINNRMLPMYMDREEIRGLHLGRIERIKNVVEFFRADDRGKIRIMKDLKIIETKFVTEKEREPAESAVREKNRSKKLPLLYAEKYPLERYIINDAQVMRWIDEEEAMARWERKMAALSKYDPEYEKL